MACSNCGKSRLQFLKSVLQRLEAGEIVKSNKRFSDLAFNENIDELKKEIELIEHQILVQAQK